MQFKVVNFRADRISGWCQPPHQEAAKAKIDLLMNGEVVTSLLAHQFRSELPPHDFADRNIGFVGTLPPQYWTGKNYAVALREQTSGTVLAEQILATHDARIAEHPGLSADVQVGNAGQLNGWAGYRDQKVQVHLLVDSNKVLTTMADQRSLQLDKKQPQPPVPTGWAFSLQVPSEYFDDAEHRIQVVVGTETGTAVIFDQARQLPAAEIDVAELNIQQLDARRPDNFPMPGLRAPTQWQNRWKVSDPWSVTTRLDDAGRLRVTTTDDEPTYLMLNAQTEDLRRLSEAAGVTIGETSAYRVGMTVSRSRSLQLQLGIYEYDALGHDILRTLSDADQRGLFVPDPRTVRIVVLLRVVGSGTFTIDDLQFLPADDVRSADPGFHPIGDPQPKGKATGHDPLTEVADFLLENPELHQLLAEVSAEQVRPLLNDLLEGQEQLQAAAVDLAARTEQMQRQLQGLRSHSAWQDLRDAFAADQNIEVRPAEVRPASALHSPEQTEGPQQ